MGNVHSIRENLWVRTTEKSCMGGRGERKTQVRRQPTPSISDKRLTEKIKSTAVLVQAL